MDISVSSLSKALNFDSSYLSRIRAGQRKPADPDKFIIETAGYIARTNSPSTIAGLLGCPVEELVPAGRCASKLCSWFSSGTKGTVCMCNSIPIEDLNADAAYMREWMRAVAMMIMKGADIRIIHDVDRQSGEMLLGLMNWIPLYMTGKVTSFYLTDSSNRIYCHTDYVSDTAALSGECIRGFHNEGKYCLTQSETDLVYYKKRAQRLFSKAKPLMKTYRSENKAKFLSFEDSEVLSGETRRNILSSLPTYTIPDFTPQKP